MRNHNDGMWTAVGWEGFFYSLNVPAQRAAKPSAGAQGWTKCDTSWKCLLKLQHEHAVLWSRRLKEHILHNADLQFRDAFQVHF